MKVGFIGLGVMGKSMAKHILDAGYQLGVYNRTQSKSEDLVEQGAVWYDSPKLLAQAMDVVITIVGYPHDVEAVYFSEEGLLAGGKEASIFIDMTTSTPSLAIKIAEAANQQGIDILDAPVSGGDKGAKEGRLTVMVGGQAEVLAKVTPILESFSSNIIHHGGHGNGQRAKAANQIMVAGTVVGMAEVLAFSRKVGLDSQKVIDTLGGGAASNWSLANYGPRILQNDYSPGFFIKHFIKDLGIVLEEAEKADLELPGTKLAYDLYNQLADKGYEDEGTQAIVKLWFE